ncbi:unnamed protein product [Diamesa serratosioi]
MSLSFDRILMDTIVLTNNIKKNEILAEKVGDDAELSYLELESMQQFHEQYKKLNITSREKTDKDVIYQDDNQIRELQLENRELKLCIEEHQRVMELIMHKYRQKTNNTICINIINKQAEKLKEITAVMKKSVELSAAESFYYIEQVSRLETENRGLCELLCFANSSKSILLKKKVDHYKDTVKIRTETAELQESSSSAFTKKRKTSE